MLVMSSQGTNLKLTAVAQWLTESTGATATRSKPAPPDRT